MDMNDQEVEVLARHLGHDPKTHKEYYRLTHSTVQLSKVFAVFVRYRSSSKISQILQVSQKSL